MLVLDFDAVLFDDVRFKFDYRAIFTHAGISDEDFIQTYELTKKVNDCYDPNTHLSILLERYPSLVMEDLKMQIDALLDRTSTYLYAETKSFLEFCKKRDVHLFLLSTGPSFQEKKISASGLASFFEEIVIISKTSKLDPLCQLTAKHNYQPVVFVDDKMEVVDEIEQNEPQIRVVQLIRRSSQQRSHLAPTVVNLGELEGLIKEYDER